MSKLDASKLAPDSVRRLAKEARDLANDRMTPGEITVTLSACADTLEMLFVKPKRKHPTPKES